MYSGSPEIQKAVPFIGQPFVFSVGVIGLIGVIGLAAKISIPL